MILVYLRIEFACFWRTLEYSWKDIGLLWNRIRMLLVYLEIELP